MNSHHTAEVAWRRDGAVFVDNRYPRRHTWRFDGGAVVPASSSPHAVRVPFSDPAGVDPEEAFVAALSSCHMLWFLSLAARDGWCVDAYHDAARGEMGPTPEGRVAMRRVTLAPRVRFAGAGPAPDRAALARLHHEAHEACFLANSVRCEVQVELGADDPRGAEPTAG